MSNVSERLSIAIDKMASLVSTWKSEYLYLQVSQTLADEINGILEINKNTGEWLMVANRPVTSCFLSRDGRYLIKLGKPEVFFE